MFGFASNSKKSISIFKYYTCHCEKMFLDVAMLCNTITLISKVFKSIFSKMVVKFIDNFLLYVLLMTI